MSIAVFDIDGVVADVGHRVRFVTGPRKNWRRFFELAATDSPLPTGLEWAMSAAAQHDLVWLTGRPEWLRPVTEAWLRDHGLPDRPLHMRPDGDYRPARAFKVEVLRLLGLREDVAVFVDDDLQVVQAAASAGFTASLADWAPRPLALDQAQERFGRS